MIPHGIIRSTGVGMDPVDTVNHGHFVSLGMIDEAKAVDGAELTLVWGDEASIACKAPGRGPQGDCRARHRSCQRTGVTAAWAARRRVINPRLPRRAHAAKKS
jgi:hypothetical protein